MSDSDTLLKIVYFNKDTIHEQMIDIQKLKALRESATRLRPNIFGLLCYSLGWISGIIMLLIKGKDRFVRFHAWQSIIVFGILTVPITVLNLLTLTDSVLYWTLFILYWIIVTSSLCLWISLMFRAYQGHAYQLRMVGNIATSLSQTWGSLANDKVRFSDVAARGRNAVIESPESERKTQQDANGLRVMLNEAVKSIIVLGETRDPYTAAHQQRVAQLACAIAREVGISDDRIEGLQVMGNIHDIGKVTVPAEILSKPGRLNIYEFGIIKTHPGVAYNIVKGLEFPWPVAQAVFQHHERLNGSGYPRGISGDDIILEAKILGVADVVEAMASHRPYRPALGINKALEEISQNRGILYDASVVDACLRLVAEKGFKFNEEKSSSASHIGT
ncbi:MAG: HD domain-containing phosphohydrolase [Dehalococcoidia bacterium]